MRNKVQEFHPIFRGFGQAEGGVCPYASSSIVNDFDRSKWKALLREHDDVSQEKAIVMNLQAEFGEDLFAAAEFIQESNQFNLRQSIELENSYFGKWFVIFMGDFKSYLGDFLVNPECHPRHFDKSIAVFLRRDTIDDIDLELSNQITNFEYRKWIAARMGKHLFTQVNFVRKQDLFTDEWKISITKNESSFSYKQLFNLVYEYNTCKAAVWDYKKFKEK